MPRRQQRIEQSTGPCPVRRRPEHVARLRKEVVRMHEARDVAEDHPMRVQRALRRACRAARVDDEGWVIGGRIDTLKKRRGFLQKLVPWENVLLRSAGDADDMLQRRQLLL